MTRKVVVEVDPATADRCCSRADEQDACRYLIRVDERARICALIGQAVYGGMRLGECRRMELPERRFSAAPGEVKP